MIQASFAQSENINEGVQWKIQIQLQKQDGLGRVEEIKRCIFLWNNYDLHTKEYGILGHLKCRCLCL